MAVRSGFVAVSLGALVALAASGAGASSLERFAEFIAETLTARGEFEQKIFDRNLKLLQESRGALAFSRPGKFRWNYVKPYAQLIVGDGSRVWIYDEDLKQVTVRKLDQALGSTPAALLAGNNEAMRAFTLSDKGARDGLEWLEALPRDKEGNLRRYAWASVLPVSKSWNLSTVSDRPRCSGSSRLSATPSWILDSSDSLPPGVPT